MTEILCPSCTKRLRVNPQSKSRKLRCPVCQTEMSLSDSGEIVTAKVLSAAPIAEPPLFPLLPVLSPPIMAAEPVTAVTQLSAHPRSSASNRSNASQEPAPSSNFALWIGGG